MRQRDTHTDARYPENPIVLAQCRDRLRLRLAAVLGRMMPVLSLGGHERVIAWRLVEGRVISLDEIIDALWSDDPDGGPEYARKIVDLSIMKLRRKLASYISNECRWGWGWYVPAPQLAKFRDLLVDEILSPARRQGQRLTHPIENLSPRS